MNWIEVACLSVLGLVIVASSVTQTWGVVRVNLILAQQNRDQLAMIGALSNNPQAAALAQSMSGEVLTMRDPKPHPRMHLAGSS